MKSINVKIDTIDKVKDFVNTLNALDGDFDLVSDRYVVDAKSIMGIFSLDISKVLKLDCHDDAAFDAAKSALAKFEA